MIIITILQNINAISNSCCSLVIIFFIKLLRWSGKTGSTAPRNSHPFFRALSSGGGGGVADDYRTQLLPDDDDGSSCPPVGHDKRRCTSNLVAARNPHDRTWSTASAHTRDSSYDNNLLLLIIINIILLFAVRSIILNIIL